MEYSPSTLSAPPGPEKPASWRRLSSTSGGAIPVAVIEGDVQTDLDAQRVARYGVPAVQIITRGGCHLEAPLVRDALANIPLPAIKLLIIENVGNLVCPSNYDLGEAMKVVIASTTEGDDKPLKYPAMFRNASVLVINKIDLVPYVNSSPQTLKANALQINPSLLVFETSCTSGAGIAGWCDWLRRQASPS